MRTHSNTSRSISIRRLARFIDIVLTKEKRCFGLWHFCPLGRKNVICTISFLIISTFSICLHFYLILYIVGIQKSLWHIDQLMLFGIWHFLHGIIHSFPSIFPLIYLFFQQSFKHSFFLAFLSISLCSLFKQYFYQFSTNS